MFILPVIVSAPTRLVNMSFENGVFASISKRARVIILFKGGSQINPAGYRPKSLLSAFSKILKKLCFLNFLIFLTLNVYLMILGLVQAKYSTEHARRTIHMNFSTLV